MDISKGLYQAPTGLEEMGAAPIEIEIEDPEAVRIGMDGLEIEIEPGHEGNDEFNANLAEEMDEGEMQSIVGELLDDLAHGESVGRALEAGAHVVGDLHEFDLVHDVEFPTSVQLHLHVTHGFES